MDVTPLTHEELYTDHPIEVRVPIVGNLVEVLREFDVEDEDLKTLFDLSGMGRRGSAVVLHPEGGRDRRPRAPAGACRRAHCG